MSNEDVSMVEEELAEARAELEALRAEAADSEARASHLESQLGEAKAELAQANERAEAHESRGRQDAAAAAERYRALALEQSPELPEELVAGDSVEEIASALERARETVAKVRGRIESEAQAGRVPVGAPARSGPDLSGMSPEEKIRRGLEGRG